MKKTWTKSDLTQGQLEKEFIRALNGYRPQAQSAQQPNQTKEEYHPQSSEHQYPAYEEPTSAMSSQTAQEQTRHLQEEHPPRKREEHPDARQEISPQKLDQPGPRATAAIKTKDTAEEPMAPKSQTEKLSRKIRDMVEEARREQEKEEEAGESQEGILYLWDFGGQIEFYATHHLFLEADAINIIVLDMSKSLSETLGGRDKKSEFGVPTTQEEFLCYWMRSVCENWQKEMNEDDGKKREPGEEKQRQEETRTAKGDKEKVAVVLTHKACFSQREQKASIEQFKRDIDYILKHNDLPTVNYENIFALDNELSGEEEFNTLRQKLFGLIHQEKILLEPGAEKKLWGLELPTRWLALEADLHKTGQQHLSIQKVLDMAKEVGMDPREDVEDFLRFHHAIGDLMHFPFPPALRDRVIVDPQWLVDAFKAIITAAQFVADIPEAAELITCGQVSKAALTKLWIAKHVVKLQKRQHEDKDGERRRKKQEEFGEAKEMENEKQVKKQVDFLIELMAKFDLILKLGIEDTEEELDQKFLVPCMLPHGTEEARKSIGFFQDMSLAFKAKFCLTTTSQFPVGTFGKLVPKLHRKWPLLDAHASQRSASFQVCSDDVRIVLTVTQKRANAIEVTVWINSHTISRNPIREILQVRQVLRPMLGDLKCTKFKLLCPHWRPQDSMFTNNPPYMVQLRSKRAEGGQMLMEPEYKRCLCHRKQLDHALEAILPGQDAMLVLSTGITCMNFRTTIFNCKTCSSDASGTFSCNSRDAPAPRATCDVRRAAQNPRAPYVPRRTDTSYVVQLKVPVECDLLPCECRVQPCSSVATFLFFQMKLHTTSGWKETWNLRQPWW